MLSNFFKAFIYGLHIMTVFIFPLKYAVLLFFISKFLFYCTRQYIAFKGQGGIQ